MLLEKLDHRKNDLKRAMQQLILRLGAPQLRNICRTGDQNKVAKPRRGAPAKRGRRNARAVLPQHRPPGYLRRTRNNTTAPRTPRAIVDGSGKAGGVPSGPITTPVTKRDPSAGSSSPGGNGGDPPPSGLNGLTTSGTVVGGEKEFLITAANFALLVPGAVFGTVISSIGITKNVLPLAWCGIWLNRGAIRSEPNSGQPGTNRPKQSRATYLPLRR